MWTHIYVHIGISTANAVTIATAVAPLTSCYQSSAFMPDLTMRWAYGSQSLGCEEAECHVQEPGRVNGRCVHALLLRRLWNECECVQLGTRTL